MHIEFLHKEHAPREFAGARLTLGAAADNDLVVEGIGVAEHHLVLTRDARGLVLNVCPGAARVYVNARPVQVRALLHAGDHVGLGSVRLRLVGSADETGTTPAAPPPLDPEIALRVIGGPHSGCVLPLPAARYLDAAGRLREEDRESVAWLVPREGRIRVESMAPATHALRVNGVAVRQAWLDDGDQLACDAHRLLADVSGCAPDAAPAGTDAAVAPRSLRAELWLVATAVLLAAVMVLVLLLHG